MPNDISFFTSLRANNDSLLKKPARQREKRDKETSERIKRNFLQPSMINVAWEYRRLFTDSLSRRTIQAKVRWPIHETNFEKHQFFSVFSFSFLSPPPGPFQSVAGSSNTAREIFPFPAPSFVPLARLRFFFISPIPASSKVNAPRVTGRGKVFIAPSRNSPSIRTNRPIGND